jgi:hypothetical protein
MEDRESRIRNLVSEIYGLSDAQISLTRHL